MLPLFILAAAGAAIALWLAGRRVQREAEQLAARMAAFDGRIRADVDARRALIGTITHELRSPIAAILGYQELLADGIYGELDGRARDALDRIGRAARQLRALADGIDALDTDTATAPEPDTFEAVDPAAIIDAAVREAGSDASMRSTTLVWRPPARRCTLHTEPHQLTTLLDLLLFAAIKTAPDGTVEVHLDAEPATTRIHVLGTRLAGPADAGPASGAALRIAIAEHMAAALGGRLLREPRPDGTLALTLELPAAGPPEIDGGAGRA